MIKREFKVGDVIGFKDKYFELEILIIEIYKLDTVLPNNVIFYKTITWSHRKEEPIYNYDFQIKSYSKGYLYDMLNLKEGENISHILSPISHFFKLENLYQFFCQFKEIYILGISQKYIKREMAYNYNLNMIYGNVIYLKVDNKYLEIFMIQQIDMDEEEKSACDYVWINLCNTIDELHINKENNYTFYNIHTECKLINIEIKEKFYLYNYGLIPVLTEYVGIAFETNKNLVLTLCKIKDELISNRTEGIISNINFFEHCNNTNQFLNSFS